MNIIPFETQYISTLINPVITTIEEDTGTKGLKALFKAVQVTSDQPLFDGTQSTAEACHCRFVRTNYSTNIMTYLPSVRVVGGNVRVTVCATYGTPLGRMEILPETMRSSS